MLLCWSRLNYRQNSLTLGRYSTEKNFKQTGVQIRMLNGSSYKTDEFLKGE